MATTREKLIDWLADLPDNTEIGIEDLELIVIAPEALLSMSSGGIVLVIPYAFAVLFSGLLIMLLMKRAANTLQESVSSDHQSRASVVVPVNE